MPIDPVNNANQIGNIGINANQIANIGVGGPSVIPTINPPITKNVEIPVVRGLDLPVVNLPDTRIKYPTVNVPTQQEFDAAVKAEREKEKQQEEEKDKPRGLSDTKPPLSQPAIVTQTPPVPATTTPVVEVPDNPQINVAGLTIDLPDPSLVATAGAVAVVTTAATMVSSSGLNMVKNAAEPLIREAVKNKFKIKLKQVKPVLHYVMTDTGHVDIFQYSADGTKLIDTTDSVENYLRAQVETNAFYETENVIIIDDVVGDKFTKEGQKRFKSLFAPAKKIAKKLSARLSF